MIIVDHSVSLIPEDEGWRSRRVPEGAHQPQAAPCSHDALAGTQDFAERVYKHISYVYINNNNTMIIQCVLVLYKSKLHGLDKRTDIEIFMSLFLFLLKSQIFEK